MISPILRKVIATRPLVRAGSSSSVGPWGPITFAGVNWVGKGALPFGFKNRFLWYTFFCLTTGGLFAVPFINLEMNVHAARPGMRQKQEELKEQMRGETSMKI
ncbi:hypothetical protein BC830DRAFT_1091909 [Chytriomyces sp. MP71]|nr:hypothetical protein BC830DRAFT_1091909 [Chytriomyces sp. MP71]